MKPPVGASTDPGACDRPEGGQGEERRRRRRGGRREVKGEGGGRRERINEKATWRGRKGKKEGRGIM